MPAVYVPPFAKARRMGHPSFLELVKGGQPAGHEFFDLSTSFN